MGSLALAGLGPFLFLSLWSGRRLMCWVQHYLGPGSLALRWVASGRAWAAGLGLGGWLNSWGRGFCWLLSLRHLGATRSSCRAGALGQKVSHCLGDFCVAVNHLVKPSTAGTNRPVGETGESRKGILSASIIYIMFNHMWCLSTTRLAMDLLIDWAIILVARRARTVELCSFLRAAGFRLDSSMERITFARNTCRNAME